jgi:hypothetical protein
VYQASRPRQLCYTCHADRTVRALYPTNSRGEALHDDATDAELDALIAERRKNLPAWYVAIEQANLEAAANEGKAAGIRVISSNFLRGVG